MMDLKSFWGNTFIIMGTWGLTQAYYETISIGNKVITGLIAIGIGLWLANKK